MRTNEAIDWSDVEGAAKSLVGNWRKIKNFAWSRGYHLDDANQWAIWYTSHRDAGLLDQSNEHVINERLGPFAEGGDPDLVFESHSHWAVGHFDGFSVRVYHPDGTISEAFCEFCSIKEDLNAYAVLNAADYSDREYAATLENYASAMWRHKNLPAGWKGEVFSWFCDNGHD